MLNTQELQIVISTLNQRQSWLNNKLQEQTLDEGARRKLQATSQLLTNAIQKLQHDLLSQKGPPGTNTTHQKPAQRTNPPPTLQSLDDARILIADDDAMTAELLRGIVEDCGITKIDIAIDGDDALNKIRLAKSPYHLVLCDWKMPKRTGIAVYQAMKGEEHCQHTAFILVTSMSEATQIREAMHHGIKEYVVKPVDNDTLSNKIKLLLPLN
jgi:two-component system chemotaxis response regulator CheY